jgi:circadian clock protein KaiA
LYPILSLCAFLTFDPLIQSLQQLVRGKPVVATAPERYTLSLFSRKGEFLDFIEREKQQIDCLILQDTADLPQLCTQLQMLKILLPTLVLVPAELHSQQYSQQSLPAAPLLAQPAPNSSYHSAMLRLPADSLDQFDQAIDQAVRLFLQLAMTGQNLSCDLESAPTALMSYNPLLQQQRRLAEKLKERLGYLGVYYKRNPRNFFRQMSLLERQEFLQQLKADYRKIIVTYFSTETDLNDQIDNFVNLVFFADIAVAQVVEIHMELMDEISKQLRLEGRDDEVLLDYRLTLIDAIAHLCEMYRRSIPRQS